MIRDDDGEKVELTFGEVRRAAESCPDAKRVLEELAPKVFAPVEEWEDVTARLQFWPEVRLHKKIELGVAIAGGGDIPFCLSIFQDSISHARYKLENGRAYRLRA